LDALFLISVYSGLKCYPSLLYTTGVRVPSRNVRNSPLLTVTCTNSPTARCVTAANRVCKDVDIFRKPVTSLKQFLCWNWTYLTSLTLTYLYFFRVQGFCPSDFTYLLNSFDCLFFCLFVCLFSVGVFVLFLYLCFFSCWPYNRHFCC
jgi:hypothetical protein